MKKITMLRTEKGSSNGITITEFKKGVDYEVDDLLAENFVEYMKCAEYKKEGIETPEQKTAIETPESKTVKVAK